MSENTVQLPTLLTKKQFAEYVKKNVRTVEDWVYHGRIPDGIIVRLGGRGLLFRSDKIQQAIDSGSLLKPGVK